MVRPRSRGWIRPVQGGLRVRVVLLGRRRLKWVKTEMRGGKSEERVSHPIPILGEKMKKRGVYSCNKVFRTLLF